MDTIYWAVKLDDSSKSLLLSKFPPVHPNVYAEHMTIVFKPSESIDNALMKQCGNQVNLNVIGYSEDKNGQAAVVKSDTVSKMGGGVPHITISCANGIKPVYSNELLKKHYDNVSSPIILNGIIARFTNKGWDTCGK